MMRRALVFAIVAFFTSICVSEACFKFLNHPGRVPRTGTSAEVKDMRGVAEDRVPNIEHESEEGWRAHSGSVFHREDALYIPQNKGQDVYGDDKSANKGQCLSLEKDQIMCVNGGTCFAKELPSGMRALGCNCPRGWTGERCEYRNTYHMCGIEYGININDQCYFISNGKATAKNSANVCSASGLATKAAISNQYTQATLANWLKGSKVPDVMIDLVEEEPHKEWYWVSDDTNLAAQGCFADHAEIPDLPTEVKVPNLTPQKCIKACKAKYYKFAGLQAGDRCFCGNSYGRYGTAAQCEFTCASDELKSSMGACGGINSNSVYDVNGIMYGSWAQNQPNNEENYQYCGLVHSARNMYQLADENCGARLQYICHISHGFWTRRCYIKVQGFHHFSDSNACLWFGTAHLDWYTARRHCRSYGGDLVTIADAEMHARVKKLINKYGTSAKYWTGLSRIQGYGWKWRNGAPLTYTAWSDTAPDKRSEACAVMSHKHDYQWDDVSCDTGGKYHFLCSARASSSEYPHYSNVYRTFSNDEGKQDGLHGDYMELKVAALAAGVVLAAQGIIVAGAFVLRRRLSARKEEEDDDLAGVDELNLWNTPALR